LKAYNVSGPHTCKEDIGQIANWGNGQLC